MSVPNERDADEATLEIKHEGGDATEISAAGPTEGTEVKENQATGATQLKNTNSLLSRLKCFKGLNVNSFVLLIALMVHALIEGLALGLTRDSKAVVNLIIAMTIHKVCASISLGISLSKNTRDENKCSAFYLMAMFSLATPVGIAIGLGLQSSSSLVEIIFNSFAAGTFIYIAASDILIKEFEVKDRKKCYQLIFFIIGTSVITCLWLIEAPHSH